MKKIFLFPTLLLLAFASGCQDDASLDGLESKTKEDEVAGGETETTRALREKLVYTSELDYNWLAEYTPTEDQTYTVLCDFRDDSSLATDSPVSDNERSQALFSITEQKDKRVAIKFDGPTMFSDEALDEKLRETLLYVETVSEDGATISCVGAATGKAVVLKHATSADVQKLGEKLIWLAFSQQNLMSGIVRNAKAQFQARYEIDKKTKKIEWTWIDTQSGDAKHVSLPYTLSISDAEYRVTWEPQTINDTPYGAFTYTLAGKVLALDAADRTLAQPMEANGGFVDKASKHYFLGGKTRSGKAHTELWNCLAQDFFRSIQFYVYPDDLPLRVEVYKADGVQIANYLFVNDYNQTPKSAIYDHKGDWIRFYPSLQGDFTKDVGGDSATLDYKITQMAADFKPFTDFYFGNEGLYVVSEEDKAGMGYYLISKSGKLWAKVRNTMYNEGEGGGGEQDNALPDLVASGMKPYGTFFDNEHKYMRLHYNLNVDAATVDLIWITDTEAVYTDGNYKDMAMNKAQYKTMGVTSTVAGEITFAEPLKVGSVTYKGLSYANGIYTPLVEGLACTIRTPMSADGHPLEYFFTYPVKKYEAGAKPFMPRTQLCLPTAADNIAGLTGTERYIFYPNKQAGGMPAGPSAIEIMPVGKGQRIDFKSFFEGLKSQAVSIPVASYRVENDRMIFTAGTASGTFRDAEGGEMSPEESMKLTKPLEKLFFSAQGFHVYKLEASPDDSGRHYFYLISPDPTYPYWIKVREG